MIVTSKYATEEFSQTPEGLPVLSDAERHQLLVEWNDTRADYPKNSCVHDLIEAQVRQTPQVVAVVCEGRQLSYRDLNAQANRLAHHLRKLGARPDKLVGVCLERSPEMVVALLGVLKSGAAYVPLDPLYPVDRLSFMVEDSGLNILVTQESLRSKFPEFQGQFVSLDSQWDAISQESDENNLHTTAAENLAYVIYTSGSTGKPKGVQISHQCLVNFLVSMRSSPGLTAEDTLLAVTTVSFDIAALELYLPLTVGARLAIVSREAAADGYRLQEELAGAGATVMQATPATWRLLLEAGWQGGKDLKVLCGGEAMPRDLARELLKRASSVWNMYGPTETTVWSTTSRIVQADGPITVGKPIANTEIYVLGSQMEPVPIGALGELYIGGDGVARGYLNRPELTAEKFIPHPFRDQNSGARLYRTGDLARYLPNGEIECLGRIDHQVKVRGFRIELGEIESVLSNHPAVRQNVVVAQEDSLGDKRLVAYVVAESGSAVSVNELRTFAKGKLPEYMVPSRFQFLDALPLTPNGKVDRQALPAPGDLDLAQGTEYVPPADAVESQLAKIWEAVLSIRNVGVKENFFDLGGHSLLVAKLLSRIDRAFGKKLSMAAIFQAPTIEQQAAMVRNGAVFSPPSAVVPIQPSGSKSPFFFCGFHAGPLFLPLARRLGSDQPFLSVDPTLLEMSQLPTSHRMEDIAACLVKQVREIQPEGPYYLGGFCAGALMAYEVARQLTEEGQQVDLLALFEPQTPADYNRDSNRWRFALLAQKTQFHLRRLIKLKIEELRPYLRDRSRTFFNFLERLFSHTLSGFLPGRSDSRPRNLDEILSIAYRDYRPQPFTGRATLFPAVNRLPGSEWYVQYWRELVANLEVQEIPGYSNWVPRFFVEPDVQILANKLSNRLARCERPEAQR